MANRLAHILYFKQKQMTRTVAAPPPRQVFNGVYLQVSELGSASEQGPASVPPVMAAPAASAAVHVFASVYVYRNQEMSNAFLHC